MFLIVSVQLLASSVLTVLSSSVPLPELDELYEQLSDGNRFPQEDDGRPELATDIRDSFNNNSGNIEYHFHYHFNENERHNMHNKPIQQLVSETLSRYVKSVETLNAQIASMPDEADTVCREAAHVSRCQKSSHWQYAVVDTAVSAMKRACLGELWNGTACLQALERYRDSSVHKFNEIHEIGPSCVAAPVRRFRRAGGLSVRLPCGRSSSSTFTPVYYRHVYVADGGPIKDMLLSAAADPNLTAIDEDWFLNHRCMELNGFRARGSDVDPVLFTFVRNPIDRFVAGYLDMCTRGFVGKLNGSSPGTEAHARAFVNSVLHGSCDSGNVLGQAHMLIGDSCESKFDFIGRVEDIEKHGNMLSEHLGCSSALAWKARVDSMPDTLGAGIAMRAALDKNGGALTRLLCWWFMPDFVLFGYDLPTACERDPELARVVTQSVANSGMKPAPSGPDADAPPVSFATDTSHPRRSKFLALASRIPATPVVQ